MFQKKAFRIIIGVVIVIVLFFLFLSWRGKTVKIETALVQRAKIAAYISTPGTVNAKVADLGVSLGGRATRIYVKEGDKVKVGQMLVLLDGYSQAKRDYDSAYQLFKQGFASQQQLDSAKTLMENKRIISPIDGIVTKVSLDEGEIAPPSQSMVTVVNLSKMWIEVQIDEADIASVHVGQKARVYSEAYPDSNFEGKITWLNFKAELEKTGDIVRPDEEDKVFRADVSLNAQEIMKFRPGMSLTVDLLVQEKENALVVPRSAVVQNKKREAVAYVVERRKVKERQVETGIADPVNVEILKGLSEGDRVAISNVKDLQNGTRVQVQK